MNNYVNRHKIHKLVKELLSSPKYQSKYDSFYNKDVNSFGEKFFVINFDGVLHNNVLSLMKFLSTIHKYYTEDRFIIANLKSSGQYNGLYTDYRLIIVNDNSAKHELVTIVHEVGHMIEIFDVQIKSSQKQYPQVLNSYRELKKEIKQSSLAKKLKSAKNKKGLLEEEKELLKYHSSPNELFAKSYTLYIYRKLFKHVKNQWKSNYVPTIYSELANTYMDQYIIMETEGNSLFDEQIHWENNEEFREIEKAWDKFIKSFNCYEIYKQKHI